MLYNSTQNAAEKVEAAQAISQGISKDGGLFVPTAVPALDTDLDALAGMRLAVTVEDHCINGGFGSSVAEYLSERDDSPRVLRLGMPDVYLPADTPAKTLARAGLDANGIASATLARLGR